MGLVGRRISPFACIVLTKLLLPAHRQTAHFDEKAAPPGTGISMLQTTLGMVRVGGFEGIIFHVIKERPPASLRELTVDGRDVLMHNAQTEVRVRV